MSLYIWPQGIAGRVGESMLSRNTVWNADVLGPTGISGGEGQLDHEGVQVDIARYSMHPKRRPV